MNNQTYTLTLTNVFTCLPFYFKPFTRTAHMLGSHDLQFTFSVFLFSGGGAVREKVDWIIHKQRTLGFGSLGTGCIPCSQRLSFLPSLPQIFEQGIKGSWKSTSQWWRSTNKSPLGRWLIE